MDCGPCSGVTDGNWNSTLNSNPPFYFLLNSFLNIAFLDVPFTLKLRSISVSLGQPWDSSQVLACVFRYLHQKPTLSCQILGWVKGEDNEGWMSFIFINRLPRWLSGKELVYQFRRCKRLVFDPCVGKIPWRRAWQPSPVFLSAESRGQRNLLSYSPYSRKESDVTEVT